MVVHFGVPEQSLVAISPKEVLGPDVLVRVLDLLLKRRLVRLVLPVLGPQAVGIDACEDERGDDNAASVSCVVEYEVGM